MNVKLFLADFKKLHSYNLPDSVTDNFFIMQFDIFYNDNVYKRDITLKYQDGDIFIEENDLFKISYNGEEVKSLQLKENTIFFILFNDFLEYFPVYVLPSITNYQGLNIGHLSNVLFSNHKDSNVNFHSPNDSYFSLYKVDNSWHLRKDNVGELSLYLNNYVYDDSELHVGDVIFFYGTKFIFMGTYLLYYNFLYYTNFSNVPEISLYNENYKVAFTNANELAMNVTLYNESQLFTHKPRVKNVIKKQEVLFEEPPAKVENTKVPAIFTLGSSSVMMLTSGMSLLSAVRNHSNGYLDTFGFITEIVGFGSMFIASLFIPFLMEKYEIFIDKKNEKKRVKKYSAYLESKKNEIAQIINSQEETLKIKYSSLEQIEKNILGKDPEVWCREIVDDDFLEVVVGNGDIPAEIEVSKINDSFSLDEDEMKNAAVQISNADFVLRNVPVTYSISKNKVMPIVIFFKDFYDYVNSIILQIIYYHILIE